MKIVKKSVNISEDMMEEINRIIEKNPGLSFTVIVSQALRQWLKNPTIEVSIDSEEFNIEEEIEKDKELINELAKALYIEEYLDREADINEYAMHRYQSKGWKKESE